MSYILDALKKSEQERGNGSVPGVQTIHSSSINYHQHRRTIWPWLIVLVVVNIAVLFYFMRPGETPLQAEQEHPAALPGQTALAAIEQPPEAIIIDQPRVVARTTAPDEPAQTVKMQAPVEIEPLPPETGTQAGRDVLALYELPLNIRQHIPEMTFSAHVYSSNALQRSLVINGRFMEEGDQVTNELVLVEITRTGAIFDYRNHRFSTSVLSGWN